MSRICLAGPGSWSAGRHWGSCGAFIPPFVDVMVPHGSAYVWFVVTPDGEDLSFERWGDETWAGYRPDPPPPPDDPANLQNQWDVLKFGFPSQDHEWLQEEVSNVGWPSLLDATDYHRRTWYGYEFEIIQWALEHGIAPDQPFLVRIDPPHSYRVSYEYDEWDTEHHSEVVTVTPLDPAEGARRWQDILDTMGAERLLAEVKQDATESLYNRPHPVIEEAVAAYRADHPEKPVCATCGGTGTYEDDATGALGYLVKKRCPDCTMRFPPV